MNYIDKHIKTIEENDTVGIIICKQDNNVIKYCYDDRIIAREYKLMWAKIWDMIKKLGWTMLKNLNFE